VFPAAAFRLPQVFATVVKLETPMLRSLLVLLFAIGHFVAPQAARFAGFGLPLDKAVNTGVPPPEQPTGFTFAIWGVIFALALLFAIRQAMPTWRDSALYQSIGWSAVVAFAANCAWMLVAQFQGNGPALVGTIWVIWVFAARAFFRTLSMRPVLESFDRYLTLPLFGILTAWLSAAAVLNTASYLRLIKVVPPALTPTLYAALVLVVIAVLSLAVLRRAGGYLPAAVTTLWALGGVAYANYFDKFDRNMVMLACGLMLIVVAALAWQKRPPKVARA
jgi:hypothetical protein